MFLYYYICKNCGEAFYSPVALVDYCLKCSDELNGDDRSHGEYSY